MYKGKKIKFNLEERNYSVRELSEISKYSKIHVRQIFNKAKVKSIEKVYCEKSRQKVSMYNHNDINLAFNQIIKLYAVPKKERKPYFEFAYKEYQSKINSQL